MLPPYELKNKSFSKAVRGYNPIEVDEYIAFIIEKYTELYRENDELERRLKAATLRLDEIRSDEDSIRGALVDAKRAATKIKADAEEKAEAIVRAAKESCNTILDDFNKKITLGTDTISELRRDAVSLKKELFEKYSEHIKYIEALTENLNEDEIPDVSELNKKALDALKNDVFAIYDVDDNKDIEGNASEDDIKSVEDSTREFDIPNEDSEDESEEGEPISVERFPLVANRQKRLREQVLELGKAYKDEPEEQNIINTPDSDNADDIAYMDFIRSVGGKKSNEPTTKDADFDMIFSDNLKKRRK